MQLIQLIGLPQAKTHLNVTDTARDFDIEQKILQASGIVLDYMKLSTVPAEWLIGSPATTIAAPEHVKALTCLVLGSLFFGREGDSFSVPDNVWRLVERPPTLR